VKGKTKLKHYVLPMPLFSYIIRKKCLADDSPLSFLLQSDHNHLSEIYLYIYTHIYIRFARLTGNVNNIR
jgi:hypothetical protein